MRRNLLHTYLQHGCVVIPIKIDFVNDEKNPHFLVSSWQHLQNIPFEDYINNEFPHLDFSKATHVGIVLPPCGLVLLDFDDTKRMPSEFVQNAYEVAERYNLVTINTGSGMHLYFRRPSDEILKQVPRKYKKGGGVVEFKDYGVAFAPLYDSDVYYTPVRFFGEGNLIELTTEILNELQIPLQSASETHKFCSFLNSTRRLDDEKINVIADLIEPHYFKGQRNEIVFSLAGMLRKLGVSYEDTLQIVKALIERTNDEEPSNRIDAVRRTYAKTTTNDKIVGSSRLIHLTGDKAVVYEIINIVRGESLKFDDLFMRTFATTGWWEKQVLDVVMHDYIALTDHLGRVAHLRKFNLEKGVWEKFDDLKAEIAVIISDIADEWKEIIWNADCDEKVKLALLTKLSRTKPSSEAKEIYPAIRNKIRVSAADFYTPLQ